MDTDIYRQSRDASGSYFEAEARARKVIALTFALSKAKSDGTHWTGDEVEAFTDAEWELLCWHVGKPPASEITRRMVVSTVRAADRARASEADPFAGDLGRGSEEP